MQNAPWIEWLEAYEPDLLEEYMHSIIDARKRLTGYSLHLELKDIDEEWESRTNKMIQAKTQDGYILARES